MNNNLPRNWFLVFLEESSLQTSVEGTDVIIYLYSVQDHQVFQSLVDRYRLHLNDAYVLPADTTRVVRLEHVEFARMTNNGRFVVGEEAGLDVSRAVDELSLSLLTGDQQVFRRYAKNGRWNRDGIGSANKALWEAMTDDRGDNVAVVLRFNDEVERFYDAEESDLQRDPNFGGEDDEAMVQDLITTQFWDVPAEDDDEDVYYTPPNSPAAFDEALPSLPNPTPANVDDDDNMVMEPEQEQEVYVYI